MSFNGDFGDLADAAERAREQQESDEQGDTSGDGGPTETGNFGIVDDDQVSNVQDEQDISTPQPEPEPEPETDPSPDPQPSQDSGPTETGNFGIIDDSQTSNVQDQQDVGGPGPQPEPSPTPDQQNAESPTPAPDQQADTGTDTTQQDSGTDTRTVDVPFRGETEINPQPESQQSAPDPSVNTDRLQQAESRQELRQTAAEEFSRVQTGIFTAEDVRVGETGDGLRPELTQDAIQRTERQQFANQIDSNNPGFDVSREDVTQTGDGLALTREKRRQMQEASAARDFDEQIGSQTIGTEDVTPTDDGPELTRGTQREVFAARADDRTDVDVTAEDVLLTRDGPELTLGTEREARALRADEQTPVDIDTEDVQLTPEGVFGFDQGTRRELFAEQADAEFPGVDIGTGDVQQTDDGFALGPDVTDQLQDQRQQKQAFLEFQAKRGDVTDVEGVETVRRDPSEVPDRQQVSFGLERTQADFSEVTVPEFFKQLQEQRQREFDGREFAAVESDGTLPEGATQADIQGPQVGETASLQGQTTVAPTEGQFQLMNPADGFSVSIDENEQGQNVVDQFTTGGLLAEEGNSGQFLTDLTGVSEQDLQETSQTFRGGLEFVGSQVGGAVDTAVRPLTGAEDTTAGNLAEGGIEGLGLLGDAPGIALGAETGLEVFQEAEQQAGQVVDPTEQADVSGEGLLAAGSLTTNIAREGLARQIQERPAEFGGTIVGGVAAGSATSVATGAAAQRAFVSARGRLKTRGMDFAGDVDVSEFERPPETLTTKGLTAFSDEAAPGGSLSVSTQRFPNNVETAQSMRQEFINLAEEFSDPAIERQLDVGPDEVTMFSARRGVKDETFEPRSRRSFDPDAAFVAPSLSRNFLRVNPQSAGRLSEGLRRPKPIKAVRSLVSAARQEDTPTIVATAGRVRSLPDDVTGRPEITEFLQENRNTGDVFTLPQRDQVITGEAEALVSAEGAVSTEPARVPGTNFELDPEDAPGSGVVEPGEATQFVEVARPLRTEVRGETVPIQMFRQDTPDVTPLSQQDSGFLGLRSLFSDERGQLGARADTPGREPERGTLSELTQSSNQDTLGGQPGVPFGPPLVAPFGAQSLNTPSTDTDRRDERERTSLFRTDTQTRDRGGRLGFSATALSPESVDSAPPSTPTTSPQDTTGSFGLTGIDTQPVSDGITSETPTQETGPTSPFGSGPTEPSPSEQPGGGPSPSPSPIPGTEPTPNPSPGPSPGPGPSPSPSPGPEPTPSPVFSPTPSPGPGLTPQPSPQPTPRPRPLPQFDLDTDDDEREDLQLAPTGQEFDNPVASGAAFFGIGSGGQQDFGAALTPGGELANTDQQDLQEGGDVLGLFDTRETGPFGGMF